jgi:hypothetical protein
MKRYRVVFHDGDIMTFRSVQAALHQAYCDSCSTFLPVNVYYGDAIIAVVQAKP